VPNDDNDVGELSEKYICFHCVKEAYLRKEIKKGRRIQQCSYCARKRSCYDIGEIADLVEGAFEQHYVRTSDEPEAWEYGLLADNESNYSWERKGEPILYAIMNAAEIPEEAAQHMQEILEDRHADIESAQMGEETEFSSDSYYEEKGMDASYWHEEWWNFESSLKREARFFSQTAASHLTKVFDGIDTMENWDGKPR